MQLAYVSQITKWVCSDPSTGSGRAVFTGGVVGDTHGTGLMGLFRHFFPWHGGEQGKEDYAACLCLPDNQRGLFRRFELRAWVGGGRDRVLQAGVSPYRRPARLCEVPARRDAGRATGYGHRCDGPMALFQLPRRVRDKPSTGSAPSAGSGRASSGQPVSAGWEPAAAELQGLAEPVPFA